MKIIKTLLLSTVGFYATTLLYAQELKTPTVAVAEKKPAPQNGTPVTEVPSPFKKDGNKTKPEDPKLVALTIEANGPKNNLTAEQLKTLNGIADKPKSIAPVANLDAPQNIKPGILSAPAPVVIKEN